MALAVNRVLLRYKESLIGFGWILLQPVALTLIFNYIRRVTDIPTGEVPYPLFVAVGLVVWSFTSLVISQSVVAVGEYVYLLKRVALPKFLLPLSAVLASFADLCVMSLLLVGLFFYYQISLPWTIAWVPFLLTLHLVLLVGIGLMASLANVFLRDVGLAIPHLLWLWFFASPVFYPASMVPREFEALAKWNPMTGLIEGYRAALLLGEAPPAKFLIPAIVVISFIFLIGVLWFKRIQGVIADLL